MVAAPAAVDPDEPEIDPAVLEHMRQQRAFANEILRPVSGAMASLIKTQVEPIDAALLAAQPAVDWRPLANLDPFLDWVRASLLRIELPAFELPAFNLPPEFFEELERSIERRPPNWPEVMDYDHLQEVVEDDGIPLVWVPRAEVVTEVLDAPDRAARVAVLLTHRDACLDDARTVLIETTSSALAERVELARAATDALTGGHHHAAQALACSVIESATRQAIHSNSTTTADRVRRDLGDILMAELRLLAALVPLASFYTSWTPGKTPGPPPVALSRHVTVHGGVMEHFNEGNALISVLLAASVLRALQDLEQERHDRKDPRWPWT